MSNPNPTLSRTRSAETDKVVKFLREHTDGSTISYLQIRSAGGFSEADSESRVRASLRSAVNIVLRENGMVFACVNGIGIKRASDVEVIQLNADGTKRVHRAVQRLGRKMATVQPDKLPDEIRVEYNSLAAQLAAVSKLSSKPVLNRLKQNFIQSSATIDVKATLRLAASI